MKFPLPLRGIIPPLVTPLLDQDRLDEEGLARLIEHVLTGGVHGLFVLGTTGEGPSLSHRLQRELVRRACQQAAGRAPVLVGITDTAPKESLELAAAAAQAGADALVLAPPYYFPISQADLIGYIERLAAQLPLPLFLYNLPSHTKASFEVETVQRLIDMPQVIGLKDSSGDLIHFQRVARLARQRPGFSLLVGPEQLLAASVLLGGHGGVPGGANLLPRLFVELYEAAAAGDLARVRVLQDQVMLLDATLYRVNRSPSAFIQGVKSALSCLGICRDVMVHPCQPFHEEEQAQVRRHLESLGIERPVTAAM